MYSRKDVTLFFGGSVMDIEKLEKDWSESCRHLSPQQVELVMSQKQLDSAQMEHARRCWRRLTDAGVTSTVMAQKERR